MMPRTPAPTRASSRAADPVGRSVEVDAIRGLSVFMMIVVHALAFFATPRIQTEGLGAAIMIVGKGAATFVLCMGFSCVYVRRSDLRSGFLRGGRLIVLGYGLNAVKFLVPLWLLGGLPEGLLVDLGLHPADPSNARYFLLLGDILQMSGLAVVIIAFLQALSIKPWQSFGLAALVALLSPRLWGVHGPGAVSSYIFDVLWGDGYTVFFPLFPWLSYALVGLGLGILVKEARRPIATLYRQWFAAGLFLTLSSAAIGALFPQTWRGRDFYRTGPSAIAALTGILVMLFPAMHHVWPHLSPSVRASLLHLSRRVTRLYAISWIVICWSVGRLGFRAHDSWLALAVIIAGVFWLSLIADNAMTSLGGRLGAANASSEVEASVGSGAG